MPLFLCELVHCSWVHITSPKAHVCRWIAQCATLHFTFVPFSVRTHTRTHTHTVTQLLMDCSVTLSPPTSLHHQIPPWLTARAQRQVEWPLYSLSFSPHHLSNSLNCSILLGERGKEASKKKHKKTHYLSTLPLIWLAAVTRHQAALLLQ